MIDPRNQDKIRFYFANSFDSTSSTTVSVYWCVHYEQQRSWLHTQKHFLCIFKNAQPAQEINKALQCF